jgi:hypothetical protein
MAETSLKIGEQAKRRLRAILLDVIDRTTKSGAALRVLEQQMEQDPLGTLERLNKLLPADPVEQAAGPALSINLAFLDAVRTVSARPAEPVAIEAEPVRVLEHVEPSEPTEW